MPPKKNCPKKNYQAIFARVSDKLHVVLRRFWRPWATGKSWVYKHYAFLHHACFALCLYMMSRRAASLGAFQVGKGRAVEPPLYKHCAYLHHFLHGLNFSVCFLHLRFQAVLGVFGDRWLRF